ncbi:MAG TPA: protein kinase [Gemmatimonadales bacterium]|nr:protein kinase [Gemmatimonadales bacterium]
MLLDRLSAALADRYLIERELGAGGMATVYLAQDRKHDRKVAVKVLRPELAAVIGAERFLSEIKTTANLQHPHILPLHDSGEADGFLFYVMPFVEGESLRDRLNRDKQLPIPEAVSIAIEVAGALDYAHRHGVIHRDIKPENILLHDGRALVADFGIALAASRAGDTRMTETGMSLGTPHYMSPEQAMGEREITPRSDVYALGAVLYEMLVGEPPFSGPTAQSIVAKVLTEEPRPLLPKRHTVPPHVEAAVLTALEKLPADRFATAAEFVAALQRPDAVPPSALAGGARSARAARRRWRLWAPWGVALVAAVVAGWALIERGGAPQVTWNYVTLSDSIPITTRGPSLAISPDGQSIVYKDDHQNGTLWIKRADQLDPQPIPGTVRAFGPVFSADGKWIAFVADGQVRKIRVGGGASVTLADSAATQIYGIAWLDDGTIIYTAARNDQFLRVSDNGGPSTVAMADPALRGVGILNPNPLPHARGVLFLACASGCVTASIHVLDLRSGHQKTLIDDAVDAWYLPTGQILYVRRDGVALVAPFDLDKLEITGAAVPVLDGVQINISITMLAWSPAGTLLYVRGGSSNVNTELMRVGLDGVAHVVDTSWSGAFNSMALSPDGRQLAVGAGLGSGALSIWIKQLDRGPFSRLTFNGSDRRPAWSPDGRMIAFIRDSGLGGSVFGRRADGAGTDRLLVHLDRQLQEVTWSPDGKWLVVRTDNGTAGAGDIVGIRTSGDTTPVPLAATRFTELSPAVSPDGRWLAYASNETGTNEVYVRRFPDSEGGQRQVSAHGGAEPRWSRDGRTLYYLDNDSRLMAAEVRTAPEFEVTAIKPLFDAPPYILRDGFHQSYEVAPDGRSFLFLHQRPGPQGAVGPRPVLVQHWLSDLAARLRR